MKNAKEMQLDRMLDCLRNAGLTPEQLSQAEDFIAGDGEYPNYGIVRKIDAKARLNDKDREAVRSYLQKLMNSKDFESFAKVFNLLFQVYGVSIRHMLPHGIFGYHAQKTELFAHLPRPELVAILAEFKTRDVYRINADSVNHVIELAKSPEVIKKAYELADQQYSNGRILLLAAYFKSKKNTFAGITDIETEDAKSGVKRLVAEMNKAFEPKPKQPQQVAQSMSEKPALPMSQNGQQGMNYGAPQQGTPQQNLSAMPPQTLGGVLLSGIARLLGKKAQQPQMTPPQMMQPQVPQGIQLQTPQQSQPAPQPPQQSTPSIRKKSFNPEDQKLFDEYVHLLITNLSSAFDGNVPNSEVAQLMSYINNDPTTKAPRTREICDIVNRYKLNEFFDVLFIGCAAANYQMSYKLTNLIKICAHGNNFDRTLDLLRGARGMGDIANQILQWKEDFMLDTTDLICWCAKNGMNLSLPGFAENYSEEYIVALKRVDLNAYSRMIDALNKINPSIYKEKYQSVVSDSGADKRRMIAEEYTKILEGRLLPEQVDVVKSYLLEGTSIESLYAISSQLAGVSSTYSVNYWNPLKSYLTAYGHDDFFKRCRAYIAVKLSGEDGSFYVLSNPLKRVNSRFDEKEIKEMFSEFDEMGVHLDTQVTVAMGMYDNAYIDASKASLLDAYANIFNTYLHLREEEMVDAFARSNANGRYLGVYVMGINADQHKEQLFDYFSDSSKLVREELANIVAKQDEWLPEVVERLKSKKAGDRELAAMILAKAKGDYTEELKAALEVEKSKKTADAIRALIGVGGETVEGEDGATGATTIDSLVKELHKGNRKRGLAWAYESAFPEVHFTGEDAENVADETYMQAILLGYNDMVAPKYNKRVAALTDKLNKAELALYMNELYDRWIEAGAEAKKKWVLYVTAIYGGADMVVKLQKQINDWAGNSRGAIAAEAVKSMALNDSPTALLVVDGIARKYKYKQVKTAAGDALTFAANELGLTREELADRIVPDLGFNENMERIFDYGERKFKVYITPALEVEIYDENDKKLKNMPAPGKKDDEAKAAEAYAEFKQMKKQMKTTVSNQKLRLEYALTVNRKWKSADWKKLFVQNPIMHQFAISLIWGVYENDELKDTFRYMEDGTFNTVDEDEYELPEAAIIGLVHPVELDDEIKSQWQEQLSDYEITQSIEQLSRQIYRIADAEKKEKALTRVAGKLLNPLSLSGKLIGMGWAKGPAMDGGVFCKYVRDDADCKLGVELYFSGAYIGDYASIDEDDITVYDALIYNPDTVKYDSKVWGDVVKESALDLSDVPARYFSEIVYQLEKATATSTERNENWESEK